MKIILGSDHAGYLLKEKIKKYLASLEYETLDLGCFSSEKSVDYPDIAYKVARKVSQEGLRGILICGAGLGMTIAANKIKGIRAACCWNEETARLSREHNNSNILCLGSRVLEEEKVLLIVKVWLETPFSREERHLRRVEKLDEV